MSLSSKEFLKQSEEQGSIMAAPSLMTEPQYYYILDLIDTCILADVQKDRIHETVEGPITSDLANKIINELLQLQVNPLDKIKNGELLKESDLKIAITRAAKTPNT